MTLTKEQIDHIKKICTWWHSMEDLPCSVDDFHKLVNILESLLIITPIEPSPLSDQDMKLLAQLEQQSEAMEKQSFDSLDNREWK